MINPFQEFKDRPDVPEKQIPLDEILASHNSVMDGLTEGYKHLIANEVGVPPAVIVWAMPEASVSICHPSG